MAQESMTNAPPPPTWVIIPTYWGPHQGSPFDHPTPLDGESTLPRLLESLTRQLDAPPFSVLILAASVTTQDAGQVSWRLSEIAQEYRAAFPLAVADHRTLQVISQILDSQGLDRTGVDLASYAGVRNLQLLIPGALGAELVIALDDDEAVSPMHVARACQTSGILTQWGIPSGIAGPYLDSGGSAFLPEASEPAHLFDQKSALMNQTVRRMMEDDDPFPVAPMALGGNMVFPRSLFTQVGFDPGITRGEDTDYLINARLAAFDFRFDKLLAIEHLPPRHYEAPAYTRLRHDVYRFVYEREKLRLGGIAAESFDPYPGRLLRGDLLDHARMALESGFADDEASQLGRPDTILEGAQAHAAAQAQKYFEFARRWPTNMEALVSPASSRAVQESLLQ
jgi:hypothetical protein